MKKRSQLMSMVFLATFVVSYALAVPFLQHTSHSQTGKTAQTGNGSDTIQGGKPRWRVQRTTPITYDDLDSSTLDLRQPANLQYEVTYNDSLQRYVIGRKIGGTYLSAPIMMTLTEYMQWLDRRRRDAFFRAKNDEIFQKKGKEKFDFSDMRFDLGPAEKIFGPGGVRIRTQGTAELKLGGTIKNIENPSLSIRNRKTTALDFDEKINLSVNGKVGDKVNMNLNYNTDATFDFDTQNLKLKYDGKEDDIIKLVEIGNVSFPSNSALVTGASSLFGVRTDMQFGRLKLQLVASQKKSSSKSVRSKGGVQMTPFEINAAGYEENTHFYLSQHFLEHYDEGMRKLPHVTSGVTINRIEVWITNKSGSTMNTRNIVALTDLGENRKISNPLWSTMGYAVPDNQANSEYATLNGNAAIRDIDQASTQLEALGLAGGKDFEKVANAVRLDPSSYTINTALGYISLKTTLQSDQVLAVAFEYTAGGRTYQVGEFAGDKTDVNQTLLVKALKNTSNNPSQGNWRLMMKNVYRLGDNIQKDKFRLDVKYQSDTTGVYLTYIPEPEVKSQPLIKVLGADRLDQNNNAHGDGRFDFVDGYTVSNGRVFFPVAEPFGDYLYKYLKSKGVQPATAAKYAFTELYDSTRTVARQIAEKDKFMFVGQFRGSSANVISLNAFNVPQGSVVVTAGGVKLTEGSDYTVDYSAGEVTIINKSIIDAGTPVNVSLENNTDYSQMRKTMLGLNWQYDFSKNFQLSGTLQHLQEQAMINKVAMGAEPLNNTLWGLNINWRKESQWLTNMLDKLPFLHLTQPSQISLTGEFAQLIAGQSRGTQDNASYLDDFEASKTTIDVSMPSSWFISSVPSMFSEHSDKTTLAGGYNRSLLAWYYIDPLFTRRSSSLTPGHIKSDLNQLSNHYVREVYMRELFPNRDYSVYNSGGAASTLNIFNLAYYPNERGPYNFNPDLNPDGTLRQPQRHWGGMMRKLDTSDFETANVEYIEFWLLDPFIYSRQQPNAHEYGGDFYINLGEVSEDILGDGKKFYESGMPVDGSSSFTTTQWGRIPTQTTTTYAFATSSGARQLQDVGFNGLTDEQERSFASYQPFLNAIRGKVSQAVLDSITNDPANDNYHYFRGSDYDDMKADILRRYKYINNPQGNSPDSEQRQERYDTSYKTTPDVEDINQDYTLNEYEKYFEYRVSIRPNDMEVGRNFIVDKREYVATLRNGNKETVNWYQFRIPVNEFQKRFGGISDFTSIRFMRMFLTGFQHPIVLRFGSLDLVRGDWRLYEQQLDKMAGTGTLTASAVNIEENSEKEPVNYVVPPGIDRIQDPAQPQVVMSNEQALDLVVENLSRGESKAVYKNTTIDMRQYRRLEMFVHANALRQNVTDLRDDQIAVFIRLGSDYKNNYYEYEVPLKLTPPGHYDQRTPSQRAMVWPRENMIDIPILLFTDLKKARNKSRTEGNASFNTEFSIYDPNNPANRTTIKGNPTLGEVKTMIIGVRNKSPEPKSGEVWVNELRLKEYDNKGGWAAQGNLNVQLSDLGTVNVQGRHVAQGFGNLEQGIQERANDDRDQYSVTTSIELGKFFPEKAKVSIPLYYSYSKDITKPKYNPLDTDMRLKDALDATVSKKERDSIENIAVTRATTSNFSISNARVGIQTKRHPMPYDPNNFAFSYSHTQTHTSGQTTVYENETNWRGSINYNWTPVYKSWQPLKQVKNKSKWLDLFKKFGFNWLPQSVGFNSELTRNYYELQERDMDMMEKNQLPVNFSQQFLWNRDFTLRWDLTNNLHVNFESATHAQIEEPYTPVNKDLYPDRYSAWKDSVWQSIRHGGTPLDYNQSFSLSYNAPLNLIPILDWITANGNYTATYNWVRGTKLEDGSSLGNTIMNNRNLSLNGTLNFVRLYNYIPFLKAANEQKSRQKSRARQSGSKTRNAADQKSTAQERKTDQQKSILQQKTKNFQKEITLLPDSVLTLTHGKNSKRIIVTAKTADGKNLKLRYKRIDANQIAIKNKVDSALKIKVSVGTKAPLEEKSWYRMAQSTARVMMMLRNVTVSYRNQYAMSLPGFMPTIGNTLGQTHGTGAFAPGLDFAFGLTGDSYIDQANERGWLLRNDSVATPATTNASEDLQIRATVEPFNHFRIDLHASRTITRGKSIQYMYSGSPTTQNGTFTMTTISIRSALEGIGNATSGYYSPSFERFCHSLESFRGRVEARYLNAPMPGGGKYDPAANPVDKFSSDVLVPAFLATYTGGGSLDLFPKLTRLLPNWSVRYNGLGNLPWFREVFKSFNINHAYKSIYAVGAYSSYSSFQEYMNGLGFITNTDNIQVPHSIYNISAVSINEAFSPLLGVDMTFQNNLTAKLEYRTTRVLGLNMTSVQLNETLSRDWVVGLAYRINDFKLFGNTPKKARSRQTTKRDSKNNNRQDENTSTEKNRGINHNLNMRLDVSYRRQAALTRDIASVVTSASSGNSAFKMSLSADYTLSRMLTLNFYYDRQSNTPLLSSNSYPTTVHDFGVSLKFSLTK